MKSLLEINEGLHSNLEHVHTNVDGMHLEGVSHTEHEGRLEMGMFRR